MTLDEFLNEDLDQFAPAASPQPFETYATIFNPLVRDKVRDLNSEYAVHLLDDIDPGDVALMWQGQLVGFYHVNLLIVSDEHRGKKLSVPLILEACKHRLPPPRRTLTFNGRSALTLAWKVAHGIETDPWP